MEVSQLLNYYPKYVYLDNLISTTGAKVVNIFVDLKGCMQSVYQEWAVKYIIDQSRGIHVDDSLFASSIEFLSFHKSYARKRDITIRIFFFFERGFSTYHGGILKSYKDNRKQASFFGLDDASRDLFFSVLNKNYEVIHKVCNKIPGVWSIWLDHLEADFVPWHLRRHVLGPPNPDEIDIIYSLDKDMLQCLNNDFTFQFYRHYKSHKMLSRKTALRHYFKSDWPHDDIGVEYFPLFLAIDGDMGDGFDGVKGVSLTGIKSLAPKIVESLRFDNIKDLMTAARKGEHIFRSDFGTNNKKLLKIIESENIIIRNLKLCSFEILSDVVNGGYPLNMIQTQKLLSESASSEGKITNGAVLYSALQKIGMTSSLSEQSIFNVFNEG